MPPPRRVDKHDREPIRGRIRHSILGDAGGVFAVALLEELDATPPFPRRELFEVAGVDTQLLDGARAEGVTGRDEDFEVVLEKEEGEFGEVGGFADAVNADYRDYVGAGFRRNGVEGRRVGDGGNGAEEIEGGGWGKDFAEGGFHGCADGCFYTYNLTISSCAHIY